MKSLASYLATEGLSALYDQMLMGSWMVLSPDRPLTQAAESRRATILAHYNLRRWIQFHGYGWADAPLVMKRPPHQFSIGRYPLYIPGLRRNQVLMLGAEYAYQHYGVLWGDHGHFAKVSFEREGLTCPLTESVADWFIEKTRGRDQSNHALIQPDIRLSASSFEHPDLRVANNEISVFCIPRANADLRQLLSPAIYSFAEAQTLDVRKLLAYIPFTNVSSEGTNHA